MKSSSKLDLPLFNIKHDTIYLLFFSPKDQSQQIDEMQRPSLPSLPLAKNFRIAEAGSTKRKPILLNELGYRYGIKRRNGSGVTWLCTFWEIKGKKACCATAREFQEGPTLPLVCNCNCAYFVLCLPVLYCVIVIVPVLYKWWLNETFL